MSTNQNETPNEQLVVLTDGIATLLHENWRLTRLDENDNFNPLIEATRDEAWIAAHQAGEVDLANTAYSDLPGDAKSKSKTTAQILVQVLDGQATQADLTDPAQATALAHRFHNAWLARHQWAKGGKLDVPFDALPTDEQENILKQLQIGLDFLKSA